MPAFPLVCSIQDRNQSTFGLISSGGKGQLMVNCLSRLSTNAFSGKSEVRVHARPAFAAADHGGIANGRAIHFWEGIGATGGNAIVRVFGDTNSLIHVGSSSTSRGTITGACNGIEETFVNTTATLVLTSSDSTGWYLPSDSYAQTAYTGDTHSNTIVDGIASTAGMYSGQAISGSGIPADTRIQSVDTANQITLTAAATTTVAGNALTKTPVAKILSANYPGNAGKTVVGKFVAMDGYIFVATLDGLIYHSDLNSVSAWSSTSVVSMQESPDRGVGLARMRSRIVAFGESSIEFFYNAGNATGSVLSRIPDQSAKIGCLSAKSICRSRDTVFWVSRGQGVEYGVYMLDGTAPQKISDGATDVFLSRNVGGELVYLAAGIFEGEAFLILTVSTGWIAYAYQFSMKHWGLWLSAGDGMSVPNFMAVSTGSTQGETYALSSAATLTSGYVLSNANTRALRTIQTAPLDFGSGKYKTQNEIALVGEAAPSGSSNSYSVNVQWADDDQKTLTTARVFDVRVVRPKLKRGGRFLSRSYVIADTTADSANLAWKELDIDVVEGSI